ncbi:methionine synthase reductase isoform X8 [Narcine bancroftii]|uniref:methionine synthase reductase isoform X8 n=1 Tax=Narcine bancroftii TaxID=1343680 RepID=UPI0038314200
MLRVTGAHQVVKGSCGVFCHPFRGQASSWYRAVCAQPRGFHDRTEVLTFRAVLIEAVPKRKSIALNPPTWCSTMSLETKYRFLLLYASQKGQAKAIAEEISEKANEKGFFADLYCLSQLEKFNLEKECAPVVIITSTTGSGELPDTAKMFFKEVCGIAAPHHYAHIKYALLALGDSNYSEFANGGKIIDKQFQRLGADHFYATGYADDSVGLEIVVDPWIDNLWDALAKVCPKQDNIHEDGESISDINDNSRICKLDVESPDASEGIKLRLGADSNTTLESLEQNTSLTRSQEDCPLPAWVQSEKPLSESTLAIPALPIEYLNVVFQKLAKQDPSQECSSLAPDFTVFQVYVTKAITLTREDALKTALLLELDISNTSMTYEPGDAFSIVCPNSGNEVEYLIERLGLGDKRDHVVDLHIQPNTKKKGAHLPGYIPKGSTLQFILTWCLEIRAVPKKACLRALVEYTSESSEKRRLQELSSKQGAADYNRYIRDFNICLLDILRSLPSCNPPFTLLNIYQSYKLDLIQQQAHPSGILGNFILFSILLSFHQRLCSLLLEEEFAQVGWHSRSQQCFKAMTAKLQLVIVCQMVVHQHRFLFSDGRMHFSTYPLILQFLSSWWGLALVLLPSLVSCNTDKNKEKRILNVPLGKLGCSMAAGIVIETICFEMARIWLRM